MDAKYQVAGLEIFGFRRLFDIHTDNFIAKTDIIETSNKGLLNIYNQTIANHGLIKGCRIKFALLSKSVMLFF